MFVMVVGMEPSRLFSCKRRKESELSLPISSGIVPEKEFIDRFRWMSLERLPMCEGMDPWNELLGRASCVRLGNDKKRRL
uniref:Putative LRR receptor-like serine/threonine-protein kinase At4g08850 isoform X2 n=1 Tax=Rhizophora mucronata TaxID=61149 RepID=A0A2P2L2F1_RHIMU